MKVLMLTTQLFAYPLDGGALRSWHILRQAAKRHDITVLGMHRADRAPSAEDLERIRDVAESVIAVERPTGLGFRAANAVRSVCTSRAYNLANYYFPAFAEAIVSAVRANHYDIVHAHHLHTAQYRSLFGSAATLYDAQNIYAELWRGYAAAPGRNVLLRELALRQAALVGAAEIRAYREFDVTTMCSDTDRDYASARAPGSTMVTVPNGVDCERFAPGGEAPQPNSIVFTGAMDVPANVDACVYLAKEILPAVQKAYPKVTLVLAGRDPAPAVRSLASHNIIVTGTAPDIRPYQARAEVAVAPLRMGSGTRLKILEAMAMGKPVVATPLGAEGIECVNGEHLLLADTPERFADSIGELFASPERRQQLGAAGRQLVVEKYDWNLLESKLDGAYQIALSNAATRVKRS